MEKSDNQRLKEVREHLGLTQKEIADALEMQQGSYSDVERGKASISLNLVKKISSIYNINPNYIIIGIGDMFLNKVQSDKKETATKTATESASKNATSLPILTKSINTNVNTDVHFSVDDALEVLENEGLTGQKVFVANEPAIAGTPGIYQNENDYPHEHFYMPFMRSKGLFAAFRIQGRSMEDYILDGSWVICRLIEEEWQVTGGNLYLISTRSMGVLLKRIHTPKWLKEGIICYSDNPHYLPFTLPSEELLHIWAVEMVLQKEFPFIGERAEQVLNEFIDELKAEIKENH